jgi:heme/copper-type cytochrome/quinol oxidase subunit 2
VSTLATLLPLAQAVDAAEEGKHVITGMLIVGLIFIGVIALGETSKWLRHRRRRAY